MSAQWPRTHHSYSKRAKTGFNSLPYDVVVRIAAPFRAPDLIAASLVCIAWRDALKPLREAMVFSETGKILKREHMRVNGILDEALAAYLKGVARGSTLAMVDVGLIYYFEMGRKDEGVLWCRRAAELGDPAGQFHLAMSYLEENKPPNTKVAIEYLHKASFGGYVAAQYQLALCFQQGRGVTRCFSEAARWYVKAAEGGNVRAMFNTSVCYMLGQGLPMSFSLAGMWHRRTLDYMKTHGYSPQEILNVQQRHGHSQLYIN